MDTRIAHAYRRFKMYRDTVRALWPLSDRDLLDIGVSRGDIPDIAMDCARKVK